MNAHGLFWAVNKIDANHHQQFCHDDIAAYGSAVLRVLPLFFYLSLIYLFLTSQ
jgi:hypothetical protein